MSEPGGTGLAFEPTRDAKGALEPTVPAIVLGERAAPRRLSRGALVLLLGSLVLTWILVGTVGYLLAPRSAEPAATPCQEAERRPFGRARTEPGPPERPMRPGRRPTGGFGDVDGRGDRGGKKD